MLELPESITNARQILERYKDHEVMHVEAGQSPHGFGFYSHEVEEYPTLLCGKRLSDAHNTGGMLELIFEDMHLVFNDGINIRYIEPEGKLPKKHQLHVRFDDDSSFVCTIQMYGAMMIYPNGSSDNEYYLVAKKKPTPLTNEFDRAYFESLVQSVDTKLSAKAFLATEQRIPGLGNGTLQDILFNCRIHPQRKLKTMSDADFDAMYESIKQTLASMAEKGGRDTEKDFYGNTGGYESILSNKTKDTPCPQCGDLIVRKSYLGGNVYFCPTCQPL